MFYGMCVRRKVGEHFWSRRCSRLQNTVFLFTQCRFFQPIFLSLNRSDRGGPLFQYRCVIRLLILIGGDATITVVTFWRCQPSFGGRA
ncbi:MAG: hypothetical protein C0605_05750 [Hyphomicrobiales bacterium]|nr:MAG: hypothetical protein C0605_05750 [Hyphomicrobiales bacterium]